MAMRTLARSESSKKRATFDEKNLDENEKIKVTMIRSRMTSNDQGTVPVVGPRDHVPAKACRTRAL
eukprot:325066-Pelagomonas_calceolata.AAC.1